MVLRRVSAKALDGRSGITILENDLRLILEFGKR